MNIILIGMPASGKTTVAGVFAARGKKVYDTDAEIVNKYGEISAIFENFGEGYFRELETETVRALSGLDGVVIATGGGCVLRAENVRLLKSKGKIIYLKTLPETLLRRVGAGSGRPLLSGDAEGKLFRLYSERAPVYEAAADFTVETDGLSPEKIADKITEILR